MEKIYQTVVQGEASESDDEEEEIELPTSVIVEGEAIESDEEEIDTSVGSKRGIPPLRLSNQSLVDELGVIPALSVRQMGQPKYNTILHRKLWESNLSLCNNLNGTVCQAYSSAAKDISNCCHQLSKSYLAIQDVSHNLRLMTNDLFKLDDCIDIISTGKFLPDIKLPPPKPNEEATSSQPS